MYYEGKIIRLTPSRSLDLAFAMIGLMRHVNLTAPLDLINVYVDQTNQTWAFKSIVRTNDVSNWMIERPIVDIRASRQMDKMVNVPSGLVNMAKDYLARSFWKKIDFLRDVLNYATPEASMIRRDNCPSNEATERMTYPKSVLNTLIGIRLSNYASLWDSRNAIEAIHAVCTPVLLERPDWLSKKESFRPCCNPGSSDTMKDGHRRVLETMLTILDNYCWNEGNRKTIPNQAEKGLLLDLIESLITLKCGNNFASTFIRRQCYEYARLEDVYHLSIPNYEMRFNIKNFTNTNNTIPEVRIDAFVDGLKHLSAEAALCLNVVVNKCNWGMFSEELLKKMKPQPLNEVAIYLKTNVTLQRWKYSRAKELLKKEDDGRWEGDPVPCCEAPCDAAY